MQSIGGKKFPERSVADIAGTGGGENFSLGIEINLVRNETGQLAFGCRGLRWQLPAQRPRTVAAA